MLPANIAETDCPLRVMRVLTRANLGGPTRQAIALWHEHQKVGVQTLLVTGLVGDEEEELSPLAHGIPQAPDDGSTGGWLQLRGLKRGLDPWGDRRACRRLRQVIRAFRPDVVHTHTSKAGWVGRNAAIKEKVNVVAHTFHGHVLKDYFGVLASWMFRYFERRLARQTDLIFAISESCAEELAAYRVAPRERIRVIAPAVAVPSPLARDDARKRLGIGSSEWRVAAVGRLVPIKRHADFVHSVSLNLTLHGDLVGEGPERDRLQQLADATTSGRVRLLGAHPDIAQLLTAYDALVLPSVREGCPLVAIEAFAAGIPVVGYDVPGVRDALVCHGEGILVPVAEGPAGLMRALEELQRDPELGRRLVAEASNYVAACAPRAVAASLLGAYRLTGNARS